MAHQYYIKDFGLKMHMNLGRGGHKYLRSGTIICPTNPELHNKKISSSSGRDSRNSDPYESWSIEGIERTFKNGAEIVTVYSLVSVEPETVTW